VVVAVVAAAKEGTTTTTKVQVQAKTTPPLLVLVPPITPPLLEPVPRTTPPPITPLLLEPVLRTTPFSPTTAQQTMQELERIITTMLKLPRVRITPSPSRVILVFIVFTFFSRCLALNPAVIAPGFAQNGQGANGSEAGQVASLTSTNNFINFCLTTNKPITNGKQIKGGSCNPAPMGVIAATTNMPSAKFQSPVNGQNFQANTAFDIKMAINNLQTGNFVNAQANYYSAPQQVNQAGDIIGHSHFTVQAIQSFTSTTALDPNVFAFFKGVNAAAQGGVLTETVTNGLPAGSYRLCSINTDANHMPCLVAVAQHGSLDDCVYVSSDISMYFVFRLIRVCSSLSVVPLVTILSAARELELRTGPLLETVLRTVPVLRTRPLLEMVLVLPTMPQRLPLQQPAQVPPRLAMAQGKVQVQGTAQGKVKAQETVANRVVVACIWVTMKPALGVTTELRDSRESVGHSVRCYSAASFSQLLSRLMLYINYYTIALRRRVGLAS
jgi:hypothetical protein